jgi:chromosome segregation ATPase
VRYESRIVELENEQKKEAAKKKRAVGLFAPPPEGESEQVKRLRLENQAFQSRLMKMERSKTATPEKQNKLLDDQTKALSDCNDKVGALEKTNTELTQQNDTLEETNAELTQQNEARETGNTELTQQNKALEKTNVELIQQNEALETTNTGLTQQNETLLKQEQDAKKAEEKANTRAETLEEQVETLKASLSNAGASDSEAVEKAREAERVTAQRLYDVRQVLATAQESESNLQSRIKRLEVDLENEQARNRRYFDAGQGLKGTQLQLQQQIGELQEQIKELQEEKEVLENELADMREDRDNESKRANDLQDAGNKLKAEFDA